MQKIEKKLLTARGCYVRTTHLDGIQRKKTPRKKSKEKNEKRIKKSLTR
jgi:hypothetical protein